MLVCDNSSKTKEEGLCLYNYFVPLTHENVHPKNPDERKMCCTSHNYVSRLSTLNHNEHRKILAPTREAKTSLALSVLLL